MIYGTGLEQLIWHLCFVSQNPRLTDFGRLEVTRLVLSLTVMITPPNLSSRLVTEKSGYTGPRNTATRAGKTDWHLTPLKNSNSFFHRLPTRTGQYFRYFNISNCPENPASYLVSKSLTTGVAIWMASFSKSVSFNIWPCLITCFLATINPRYHDATKNCTDNSIFTADNNKSIS